MTTMSVKIVDKDWENAMNNLILDRQELEKVIDLVKINIEEDDSLKTILFRLEKCHSLSYTKAGKSDYYYGESRLKKSDNRGANGYYRG